MKVLLTFLFAFATYTASCWGFFAHKKINYQAVFLLPPQMMLFYKSNILFLSEHAVDPDMRRYALTNEAPRHYIDLDHYGPYPYDSLPRGWNAAVEKFGEDSLEKYGIAPWWIQTMHRRLVIAFKEKNRTAILKLSADIGHYISDAHVPLHASSNHNGQHTGQHGIHGFWESRIPEMLAETEWDFFIGKAAYLKSPGEFIWLRVLESAVAADTVLQVEKSLTMQFPPDKKYAFENRNGKITRQYSAAFARAYDAQLKGMIERRMRQSIEAVASFWYSAWVDGGQPDLSSLTAAPLSELERKEYEALQQAWRTAPIKGRAH